jgi:hypothetical protein
MIKSNLRHQVRQTSLPKWKPWIPLFEAVMNAVQAIREANKPAGAGHILIEIEREPSLVDKGDAPIHAITITDNGVGMDDENFDSFNTSYSDRKESEGGKGLGRFVWLKAFDRVEVDTTFVAPETEVPHRRQFTFDENYDPDKGIGIPASGRSTGTVIRLIGLREPYKGETALTTDRIVERLVEHFLLIFFREACPTITVHDYGLRQSANQVWEKDYRTVASEHQFKIDEIPFTLYGFRLTTARVAKHKLIYAANQRGVLSDNLDSFVPNLNRRLSDTHGNTFVYLGIVQSHYLSEHVNPARSGFDLDLAEDDDEAEPQLQLTRAIKRSDIRDQCLRYIQQDLAESIQSINLAKEERSGNMSRQTRRSIRSFCGTLRSLSTKFRRPLRKRISKLPYTGSYINAKQR